MQDRSFRGSHVETMSNSEHTNPPPPTQPPSLASLPEDIVLSCLARVPRIHHLLNLSWVSRNLGALVRSLPELKGRQTLYLCFRQDGDSTLHWFTLTTTTKTDDRLVLNPTPFPSHPKYRSSTVSVGSKIFFIGGVSEPSTDLWILDTRSGTMTQGPSMSVPRVGRDAAVGVIDGKIYVIGGGGFHDEIEVEVYDPKSKVWELAGVEYGRKASRYCASVEGKIYMVEREGTHVYNPRECERQRRMVHMVSHTLGKGGRKGRLSGTVERVCVVDDVLFAIFWFEVMWFDTKRNVWRNVFGPDGEGLLKSRVDAMVEHDGKLAVLYPCDTEKDYRKRVRCELVSLHRAGDRICGTVDWCGFVGTVPYSFHLLQCVAVSN